MKDTRFIELVNLYIDRQLSPEEAAEFELEIRTNPHRRQVYRQYCRMHRATTLVYESFSAHAGQRDGTPDGQPATIARLENHRHRRALWSYAAAALTAAACLTFVVVGNDFSVRPTTGPQDQVLAQAEASAPRAVANPLPAAEPAARPQERASARFAGSTSDFLSESDYSALLAAARLQEQRFLSSGQEQRVRVSLFDDGVFDERPTLRATGQGAPRRTRATSEFTAFQFQR